MKSTDNQRRQLRYRAMMLGSVALLVTALLGSITSIAHAGCGDYVVIGNPLREPPRQAQQHAVPELDSAMPIERPSRLPCQGPGCRQGDASPPLPVPIVITSSPELVAIAPTAGAAVSASGESCVDLRASRRVEGVFDRVERPPRFAAQTFLGSWCPSAWLPV
ncbi:MAG: hypothetical protein QF918_15300 [Pirellulaceae bacterium]|jgi:hypothetical protein|nr:hypothetical protein [Pirellulaceae bacterium]MDP6553068.1 hypothetical protein [Pirellulaceae bacterium]MDP6719479.1 hypothetical protein [Pirellulaceae bacterium]